MTIRAVEPAFVLKFRSVATAVRDTAESRPFTNLHPLHSKTSLPPYTVGPFLSHATMELCVSAKIPFQASKRPPRGPLSRRLALPC